MAENTPGPWEITGLERVYQGEVIKAGNSWVAVLCDFNRTDRDAEREANARLIAAAPSLRELVDRAVTKRIDDQWLKDARKLLREIDAEKSTAGAS